MKAISSYTQNRSDQKKITLQAILKIVLTSSEPFKPSQMNPTSKLST